MADGEDVNDELVRTGNVVPADQRPNLRVVAGPRQPGSDDGDGPRLLSDRELLEAELATAAAQGDLDRVEDVSRRLRQMASSGCFARPLRAPEIFAPLPPLSWTVPLVALAPGRVSMVAGYGYSGKTISVQSLALSVAAGLPVWGHMECKPGSVLHFDFEQGHWLTCRRYQRLAHAMGIEAPEELPLEVLVLPELRLVPEAESTWARYCDGQTLIIIDSYRVAASHVDENSSQAREPLDMCSRLSHTTGATILVLHHARKTSKDAAGGVLQSIRGSSGLFDALGSCLVFVGEKGDPPVVHHEKNGITGKTCEPFALKIEDIPSEDDPEAGVLVSMIDLKRLEIVKVQQAERDLMDKIILAVKQTPGLGSKELRKAVGGNATSCDAMRERLEREGWIETRRRARKDAWFVTESGSQMERVQRVRTCPEGPDTIGANVSGAPTPPVGGVGPGTR